MPCSSRVVLGIRARKAPHNANLPAPGPPSTKATRGPVPRDSAISRSSSGAWMGSWGTVMAGMPSGGKAASNTAMFSPPTGLMPWAVNRMSAGSTTRMVAASQITVAPPVPRAAACSNFAARFMTAPSVVNARRSALPALAQNPGPVVTTQRRTRAGPPASRITVKAARSARGGSSSWTLPNTPNAATSIGPLSFIDSRTRQASNGASTRCTRRIPAWNRPIPAVSQVSGAARPMHRMVRSRNSACQESCA